MMKDRRTKAELVETNSAIMERLSLANNRISDLEAALKTTKNQLEREEATARSWSKEAQELRKQKSTVFGDEWIGARTREHEYAQQLYITKERVGTLRGALLATLGKTKTDEIDPLIGGQF